MADGHKTVMEKKKKWAHRAPPNQPTVGGEGRCTNPAY